MIPFRTTVQAHASPNVTMGLIVVNLAIFIIQLGMDEPAEIRFVYTYGLVPGFFGNPEAATRNAIDYTPALTLITNTFLHGGWLHLIINMWTLWLFGVPVEDRLGPWRFLLLYLACGAAGSATHLVSAFTSFIPAVGASGAVAGLLGAFVWMFPRDRVAVVVPAAGRKQVDALAGLDEAAVAIIIVPLIFHVPALLFAAVWFALQIVPGLLELSEGARRAGIAWWAHIGGFVAGLAIAAWIRRTSGARRRGPWGT